MNNDKVKQSDEKESQKVALHYMETLPSFPISAV